MVCLNHVRDTKQDQIINFIEYEYEHYEQRISAIRLKFNEYCATITSFWTRWDDEMYFDLQMNQKR